MIVLYLILLAICVAIPLLLIIAFPGFSSRPLASLLRFLLPFVLLGLCSKLLVSGTGTPNLEWILPLFGVLNLWLFCNRESVFRYGSIVLLSIALLQCFNFVYLVHGDYTAQPEFSEKIAAAQQKALLLSAKEAIRHSFPKDELVPPGNVATLLGDSRFAEANSLSFERQWHTMFTGLYLIKRKKTTLWCSGGLNEDASNNIQIIDEQ